MSRPLPPPSPYLETSLIAAQRPPESPQYNVPRVPTRYPYTPGNIDITQRIGKLGSPMTRNSPYSLQTRNPLEPSPMEGGSTVYSMSFTDEHGRNVLIPTVIPDQRRGGYYVASPGEAIQHYQRTGEHLGLFGSPEDADTYARALHEDLAVRGGSGLAPEEMMNKMQRLPQSPSLLSKSR